MRRKSGKPDLHRNSGLPELRNIMRRKSGKPDLHRNSGLPELRNIMRRKSGKPDLHRNSGLPELRNIMRRKSGKPDLHRNSGLPELRNIMRCKSGKPDLRCQRPAMTAEEKGREMLLYSRALTRRQVLKASAGALPLVITAITASAQAAYPTRPVKVVIPYPPAGGADTVGRLLFQKLGQMWGA